MLTEAPPLLDICPSVSHPPRDDGVDVSGVTRAQCHEVSIERPDSLKPESDVTGRGKVQEFRSQVICSRSAVDQRGVDLMKKEWDGKRRVRRNKRE